MTEKPNACCNQAENLRPHTEAGMLDGSNVTAVKCQVCGCRHFELSVDPCEIVVRGEGIE